MLKSPMKQARKRVNTWLGITPPKDCSIGVIDALETYKLRGWFISRLPGVEGNRFILFIDDTALGTFEAVLPRQDLLMAEGVLNCGFQVDIQPLLKALPRGIHTLHDGQSHRFTLRTVRGRIVAEKLITGRSPLRGFFDKLDATGLQGWAIDESAPGQAIELSMFVDDVHYLDLKTTLARSDVTAKGLSGAQAGFRLTWPTGLLEPGANVDIRYKQTGESLAKSPRKVEGNSLPRSRATLSFLDAWHTHQIRPVTVVVPIFNAFEAVIECLSSLERTLSGEARVLLIDDASPDPRIGELLATYAERPGFEVVTNEVNLGYTCTVNKAINLCAPTDVVLLNSDTVTTSRWLENLRYAAYAQPRVATVTAMSDHAGAFSAPEMGTFNPVAPHLDRESHARLVVQAQAGRLLEVPTGNGFCMYMRRSAIDAIGTFDEQKFPRGYGEENDFCMRALRCGWLNLVCDKAYVFHKRSQSFQGEKEALMLAGAAQLGQDYPEYRLLTQRFRDAEFSHVRYLARKAMAKARSSDALPRLLYVISTQTGGTPQTNMDLMRSMKGRYQCYLLRCDAKIITWSKLVNDKLEVLETHELAQPINPVNHRSREYDHVVLDMMYRHSIDLIHIRHIGWHSLGLSESAKALGLPVVYSSHDFYAVCPSLKLMDEQLKTCGGRCTPGEGACQIELWPANSLPVLKHQYVHRWQDMLGEFLSHCDRVITTADSAARILGDIHAPLHGRVTVIPHGRDFTEFSSVNRRPVPGGRIRILVPGNISRSKGAELIKDMAELDTGDRLEFHFLGQVWDGLKGIGVHHGTYERAQFTAKVEAIAPHLGVVLSMWPETYCHTLTEMWASGLPVLGFDVGAVGERLHASGAGWPVPLGVTAAGLVERLITAADDQQGFENRLKAVRAWQVTEGTWNTTGTMSVAYRLIYQSLLKHDSTTPRRVGLIVKAQESHASAAHTRLLRSLAHLPGHDVRVVEPTWLLAGGMQHLDLVIIQADAVPASLAEPLAEQLRGQGVPFIHDLDCLLWNDRPEDSDPSLGVTRQAALQHLMQAATAVTASTSTLAELIAGHNDRVVVIPDALDASLWLQPLDPARLEVVKKQHRLDTERPRILCVGTRVQAGDLALITEALDEVIRLHPDIDMVQIGGGVPLPHARQLTPPKGCSTYPEFVAWFRHVAATATLALAPLEDNLFNQVSSNVLALDHGLARLPTVFSRTSPYQSTVTHGKTGLLCDNDTKSWVHAIRQLLADETLRNDIRSAAFEQACGQTRTAVQASAWGELFGSVPTPSPCGGATIQASPPHEETTALTQPTEVVSIPTVELSSV